MQHLVNISYLLCGLFVSATNPLFTSILLLVLYMRGEATTFMQPFLRGFLSLVDVSIYIIPFAMIAGLLYMMILNAAKHPWWRRAF